MKPLVTIIIPVYNVEKYINQCIESVVNQTYKNLEIICIDDCGSDSSMVRLKRFLSSDTRIKVVKHISNLGLGPARNTGIREAKGEYVYFLDSDDWIQPDTIEQLVKRSSSVDIVIGQACAFPDELNFTLEKASTQLNQWLALREIPSEVTSKNIFCAMMLPCVAWGKLFRKDFLDNNNLFFINGKVLHEDNGFHVKCMCCHPKIAVEKTPNYQYRIRSSSIMSFNDENKKRRLFNTKLSIDDAIIYLSERNLNHYIQVVKDLYWQCYVNNRLGFSFYWGQDAKICKVGPISIIKQTVVGKIKKTKVLGVVLCEEATNRDRRDNGHNLLMLFRKMKQLCQKKQ